MATAPNVNNYVVGKGNVYFTPEGGSRRHLGNCPAFNVEPELEELEHFSSMEGVRTKDLTVVLSKSATITLTLEEFSQENVALALMGDIGTDTEGNPSIEIFSKNVTRGRLEFIASNEIGPKWNFDFPSVGFRLNAAFSPISEEWASFELTGDIAVSNGSMGRAYLAEDSTESLETETITA